VYKNIFKQKAQNTVVDRKLDQLLPVDVHGEKKRVANHNKKSLHSGDGDVESGFFRKGFNN
jgi:hypothetical protein